MKKHNFLSPLGFVAFIAFATSGCITYPLRDQNSPQPLPASLSNYYDYPDAEVEFEKELVREREYHRQWIIRFPLRSPDDLEPLEPTVEIEWYESTHPGPLPAIVLNPILGGDYPLERSICRFFANQGFHVAMPYRKTLKISPEHRIDRLERLLRQGVIRIRQVVDWMETQEGVDPDRIGCFGVSMGGIATVMAAAVEPRFKVQVAALPGGSIPDILMGTNDKMLTKPFAKYLEANDLTQEELEAALRNSIQTDPLLLAPYVPNENLYMFTAMFDRTIGTPNAQRLWHALERPRITYLPFGHYTAYFSLPYLKLKALSFFEKRLR